MISLDPTLKKQHDGIQKTLSELSRHWKEHNITHCSFALSKLSFLLSEHHEHEFALLFSKVWDNPRLKEGGPFCTYFYNFLMLDRPFQRVIRLINQVRTPENQMKDCEVPESLKLLFEQKSMVTIPLEEHLAVKSLVREMIGVTRNWDNKYSTWYATALDELKDLIEKNIQKEETCFWELAKRIA